MYVVQPFEQCVHYVCTQGQAVLQHNLKFRGCCNRAQDKEPLRSCVGSESVVLVNMRQGAHTHRQAHIGTGFGARCSMVQCETCRGKVRICTFLYTHKHYSRTAQYIHVSLNPQIPLLHNKQTALLGMVGTTNTRKYHTQRCATMGDFSVIP